MTMVVLRVPSKSCGFARVLHMVKRKDNGVTVVLLRFQNKSYRVTRVLLIV